MKFFRRCMSERALQQDGAHRRGVGVLEAQRRTFGDDPFPYGLSVNRRALQTLADYMLEQGLLHERPIVDELFAETTRD